MALKSMAIWPLLGAGAKRIFESGRNLGHGKLVARR